jgi:hypothetical protein
MSDIFGTSNFGGNYTKKTFFKLKDGELSFRILPPIGALAAEGKWSGKYTMDTRTAQANYACSNLLWSRTTSLK